MTDQESLGVPLGPAPILDLILGFRRSKTMFTAVRFGLFDLLAQAPRQARELGEELQVDASALTRLLDGCLSLGLLERTEAGYRNAPIASRYLTSGSSATLNGYIRYSDESLYKLWDRLDDAVRDGSHRWGQVFGNRDALFDHYFRNDEAAANFLAGMHGLGQLCSPLVVRAFNLSRFVHLVDLGGATGHLAIAACEAYPKLRATVLDLPKVEQFARSYIARSHAADRIDFVAKDFFADELPPADLYNLGKILHDWPEGKILPLLRKTYAALPAGGALLIEETLVNPDRSGPISTLMQDLNMLVCTDGKERTFTEYRQLLESAGFSGVDYRLTGSPADAILGLKSF